MDDEARAVGGPVLRLETAIHQQEAEYGVSAMSCVRPYAMMSPNKIETSLFFEKEL
jgi:hypothetical protein